MPSSGKTTASTNLTKILSNKGYRVSLVPEFARDYMVAKGSPINTFGEQVRCSEIQSELEDRALITQPQYLISDIPLFLTQAYTEVYYPQENPIVNHQLSEKHVYDIIFYCRGDTFKEDGIRFQTKQDLENLEKAINNNLYRYHHGPIVNLPVHRIARTLFLNNYFK